MANSRHKRQEVGRVIKLDAASDFEIAIVGDAPPTEFRIFKAGINRTSKGNFTFDAKSQQQVLSAWKEQGNKLFMDWEHEVLNPNKRAPAAAWYSLEVRDGELWAVDVKWTPSAAAQLLSKEYGYYSPAFHVDEKLRITELINVALTNYPATKEMTPLVAVSRNHPEETDAMAMKCKACKSEIGEDDSVSCSDCMAKARKALGGPIAGVFGLAADAGDGELVAAAQRSHNEMNAVIALSGAKSHAEALGIFTAWKAGAERAEALSKEVEELKSEKTVSAFDKLVEKGKLEGKLTPAMCHATDPSGEFVRSMRAMPEGGKMLAAYLSAAPVVVPVTEVKAPEGQIALDRLTSASPAEISEAKKIASLSGVKWEDVVKHRAEVIASGRSIVSESPVKADEASAK